MGTVKDKLNKLLSTKADIGAAITEKGQVVADSDTFASYANKILAIETSAAPGTPLDPVEVYNSTRPADWLQMPAPADNEMYLLFHIPDGVSSLLAFTVTCTGNYTVALGTVTDGAFVQQSAQTLASGAKYETELFADDFGGLTSDGMKQVMVKVSGVDIKTWAPSSHSKKISPSDFSIWNIVEISCKLPNCYSLKIGGVSNHYNQLRKLRYFSFYGTNKIGSAQFMFSECVSLVAIPYFDTSSITNPTYMFYNCVSLLAIPNFNLSSATEISWMFQNCYSLKSIPSLYTPNLKSSTYAFNNCYSLTAIPQLDTSSVTNMSYMFSNCYSLTAVPQMDTGSATNMSIIFYNCYSLTAITLDPSVTGWAGQPISLSNCSLGHTAIVQLFNSLPAITESMALTLTGNPGVSELTDEEKAIATGKNWTLTL